MWDSYIRGRFGLRFERFPGVYGPEEDTVFLLEFLSERFRTPQTGHVVEVGCGLGLAAILLARKTGGRVFATDLNKAALEAARTNARMNGVELEAVRCRGIDGFGPGSVGAAVFNPPYLPRECELPEDPALDGGPTGVEVALGFAGSALERLAPEATLYILLSSLGDLDGFEHAVIGMGYKVEKGRSRSVGDFERLFIYILKYPNKGDQTS